MKLSLRVELANCPDFRKEKKELKDIGGKKGHILVPSVIRSWQEKGLSMHGDV